MWDSFRDVADDSGAQLNPAAIDAQPAATFEYMADNVFVGVNDLFGVQAFVRTEGDQTAGESLFLEAASVANLIVEFGKRLRAVWRLMTFIVKIGVLEWWSTGVML